MTQITIGYDDGQLKFDTESTNLAELLLIMRLGTLFVERQILRAWDNEQKPQETEKKGKQK